MYSSGVSKTSKPYFARPDDRSGDLYENMSSSRYSDRSSSEKSSGGLMSFIKDIAIDDILIIAVFVLLLNENKQDDYLILIILAVLFFS